MKKLAIALISIALLAIAGLLLWPVIRSSRRVSNGYTTTIELSGTPGASFTGEYLHDGKRVAFSGLLPWSGSESNLSVLEIRKAKSEDRLVLNARGGGSMVSAHANPGTKGVRVEMQGGWSVETLQ